jgi:hypothetical protein
MAQVIVYTGSNGNVHLCIPTGELPIEEVLTRDCPEGAIIIDDSALPQGDDAKYFDAWELVGDKVVVNQTKKQSFIVAQTAEITIKQNALAKLAALGLTEDEVKALLG